MLTLGTPRNHAGHDGCNGARPLTLGDREAIHSRPFRVWERDGSCYCWRCLADLPPGLEALFHVCDDELPPVRAGATVRYWGSLAGFRGTVWEVTAVDGRGRLQLFDVDRALSRVRPGSVEVLRQPEGR